MLKDFFKPRTYATIPMHKTKKEVPEGIMHKCQRCSAIVTSKEFKKNMNVCKDCGYHEMLTFEERLDFTLDPGTFIEFDKDMSPKDPLSFPLYSAKMEQDSDKTGLKEAIITGKGKIGTLPVIIGVMDARFRMGSMGSVVGEKIYRAAVKANEERLPFILFSASGGARMQEGVLSLMQMAKTSSALEQLHRSRLLFISVLTHPTTGGVSASFSSLGDINIAEPGALIGFAGRRVIEQTVHQKLPDNFQTSEFLLKHGQLDMVVHRSDMRNMLTKLLDLHSEGRGT